MSGPSSWGLLALVLLACTIVNGDESIRERRAPFSSWAGKRSLEQDYHQQQQQHQRSPKLKQLLHDLHQIYMTRDGYDEEEQPPMAALYEDMMEKRAPFSSWAGKRAPFSSWAGKRAPFSSWAGKRAPFSSWAGKRSSLEDDEGHRVKRSSQEDEDDEMAEGLRVRRGAGNTFSAWGGKKRMVDEPRKRIARNVNLRVMRPARAAFSAWGGK